MNMARALTSKLRSPFLTIRTIRNWYDILLLYMGVKKVVDFKLRSTPFVLSRITREQIALPFYFSKVLAQGKLYLKGSNIMLRFRDLTFLLHDPKIDIPCIYATFVEEEYNKFSFKDKVVLDIGAYIGDTSLFFAAKGARKVIAYEPNPEVFKVLVKNVEINKMREKILPINLAVGKDGHVDFFISSYAPGSTLFKERFVLRTQHGKSRALEQFCLKQVRVRSVSIATILNEIGPVDILKMDCEGCEFIILEDIVNRRLESNILEGIIFEAHMFDESSTMKRVVDLLKSIGFKKVFARKVSDITSFIWGMRS
ncbi:MAG: FkbM family methyltransferase [Thermofilaceae archaeon]